MGTTIGIGVGIGLGNIGISTWTPQMVTDINLAIEGHSFVAVGGYGEPIYRTRVNTGSYFDGAVGGTTIAQMVSREVALDTHLITETATRRNVLLLWPGVNDVIHTAGEGASAYSALKPYVQRRVAAGWKVDVYTMTVSDNADRTGAYHAQWEIERNVFNNSLRTDLSLIGNVYVLDTDTISVLAEGTADYGLYYPADKLHLNEMGHWLASDLFVAQLTNMYSSNVIPVAVTPTVFTATETGTGTGVSTLTLTVANATRFTLDGNGLFYTDSGGTLNPSSSWVALPGATRIMYMKCTSGVSNLSFVGSNVIQINFWSSGSNAVRLGGDVSKLTLLNYLNAQGNNTLSGSISALTLLTFILVFDNPTLSGSISALTLLTYLNIATNTLSGSISALTLLTYLVAQGNNTISGDFKNIASHLTDIYLPKCGMVDYTAGGTWGNNRITINPSVGYGYSATEIDNMLIDMAASNTLSGKTITLQGSSAARTAASNAAVTKLTTLNSGYVHAANTVVTN